MKSNEVAARVQFSTVSLNPINSNSKNKVNKTFKPIETCQKLTNSIFTLITTAPK